MKKKNIYVDVRHFDYWWGIYDFSKLTNWEDIIIFEKWSKGFRKLAWTCVCSKAYLRSGLEDLREFDDEKEFVNKIERFLENNEILYHYYYDKPNDKDFYEVVFEADRNESNIKPSSIETWYPCEGTNKKVIDTVVREFCRKFLNIEADLILYKDEICIEKAQESYVEHMLTWQQCKGYKISEDLIEQLEKELSISKEKVIKLIECSTRG